MVFEFLFTMLEIERYKIEIERIRPIVTIIYEKTSLASLVIENAICVIAEKQNVEKIIKKI